MMMTNKYNKRDVCRVRYINILHSEHYRGPIIRKLPWSCHLAFYLSLTFIPTNQEKPCNIKSCPHSQCCRVKRSDKITKM